MSSTKFNVPCVFLSIPQATTHIYRHHQPYLHYTLHCPVNARLRTYTSAKSFVSKLVPWTAHQQRVITFVVRKLQEECWTWRALLTREQWTFIQIDNTIEDGMPHTIHSAIILPEWLVKTFTDQSPSHSTYQQAVQTVVHEQIHVLQKLHREWFDTLYANWGFQRLDDIEDSTVHEAIAKVHRLLPTRTNPDTPHQWLLHKRWYLFVYLPSEAKTMSHVKYFMIDVRRLAYRNIQDGNTLLQQNTNHILFLDNCKWYNAFYGHLLHCYHPDESSAVLLAQWIVHDCKDVQMSTPTSCPAIHIATQWLNNHHIDVCANPPVKIITRHG